MSEDQELQEMMNRRRAELQKLDEEVQRKRALLFKDAAENERQAAEMRAQCRRRRQRDFALSQLILFFSGFVAATGAIITLTSLLPAWIGLSMMGASATLKCMHSVMYERSKKDYV